MKSLKAIFNKISAIETVKDLNKNKLSLHDLDVVRACFNDLSGTGKTETINKAAADFYARNGFTVAEKAISYSITRG